MGQKPFIFLIQVILFAASGYADSLGEQLVGRGCGAIAESRYNSRLDCGKNNNDDRRKCNELRCRDKDKTKSQQCEDQQKVCLKKADDVYQSCLNSLDQNAQTQCDALKPPSPTPIPTPALTSTTSTPAPSNAGSFSAAPPSVQPLSVDWNWLVNDPYCVDIVQELNYNKQKNCDAAEANCLKNVPASQNASAICINVGQSCKNELDKKAVEECRQATSRAQREDTRNYEDSNKPIDNGRIQ